METMLRFLVRFFYHDQIYTNEPELFYKLYKWDAGLYTLLELRRIIGATIFSVISIIWRIFINPGIFAFIFLGVALILLYVESREKIKAIESNMLEARTSAQERTILIQDYIRRFVSKNGKALGRKEWKIIKQENTCLYYNLLCDKCKHRCHFYSLEIAKIIKDSTLIWGAYEEPLQDGHKYYAHAVILRNGYIYDTNMRQSEKYEDFMRLYQFKIYKQWKYNEYAREDFRESERKEFWSWCKENNVSTYQKF